VPYALVMPVVPEPITVPVVTLATVPDVLHISAVAPGKLTLGDPVIFTVFAGVDDVSEVRNVTFDCENTYGITGVLTMSMVLPVTNVVVGIVIVDGTEASSFSGIVMSTITKSVPVAGIGLMPVTATEALGEIDVAGPVVMATVFVVSWFFTFTLITASPTGVPEFNDGSR